MNKTKKIIQENIGKFKDFEHYFLVIEEIENNVFIKPDIAIETCKSLIEGISKYILDKNNIPYNESGRNINSSGQLWKMVVDKMSEYEYIDDSYATPSIIFVNKISEIRNKSGDISHGRSYPKDFVSDCNNSEFIKNTTDELLFFILKIFFKADWSHTEDIKYEDNEDFNEFLDLENEILGIKYSLALFDQDIISYKEQLEGYNLNKEI